jgi:hypothetical protein
MDADLQEKIPCVQQIPKSALAWFRAEHALPPLALGLW